MELKNLFSAFRQLFGNKVYLQDLESIFKDNDKLNPKEKQAIRHLIQDCQKIQRESQNSRQKPWQF